MEYLKKASPNVTVFSQEIKDTVSRIISDVEREGVAAVRRYSEKFDAWNPPSFRVIQREIEQIIAGVDEGTRGPIDFSISQVKKFAKAQRDTLIDFEIETLPGVTLGEVRKNDLRKEIAE